MNRSWSFLIGVLATILFSMAGLVLVPNWQFQELQPVVDDSEVAHPVKPEGSTYLGRQVYISEGCIYCHSQQVRSSDFGADIARNWGTRRSVARDYIYDQPHLMGTMRTGPDLANIGARQPSREWHYLHLFNPQITSEGSVMPPFRFLFKKVEVESVSGAERGSKWIQIPAKYTGAGKPMYLLPTQRANDLVDYLLSLDHSYDLPEAHR
jgi:cytochrome c oxidase cbb3-type subunit II